MTAAEWNTFQACELEEIAAAAYEARDYLNWRRMLALARVRWLAVEASEAA